MPNPIPLHRILQINLLRIWASQLSLGGASHFPGASDPTDESSRSLASRIEQAARLLEQAELPVLGPTPKELIWRKNKSRLYRYTSGKRQLAIPLFVVYGLINKPTILDLTERESFIAYLISQGFTVYLLDWGFFGPEDAGIGLSELLLHYLPRAIRAMQTAEENRSYHLLGYCMGGTLAAVWTAWSAAQEALSPKSLSLLAAPVDFHHTGLIGKWLKDDRFNPASWMSKIENVPGEWLKWGSMWTRPYENFFLPLKRLILRGEEEEYFQRWLALDAWLHDNVPFPKAAFVDWIQCFYQENQLIQNRLKLGADTVRLDRITCPLFAVIAEKDDLVTPKQIEPLLTAVKSDQVCSYRAECGHVSMVVGPYAQKQVWPAVVNWLLHHTQDS